MAAAVVIAVVENAQNAVVKHGVNDILKRYEI